MQRVNFFSEDMLPQRDVFTFKNLIFSLLAALLFGALISFYYSLQIKKLNHQQNLVEQTAEDINAKISSLNIGGGGETDVQAKAESLNRSISSKQQLLSELENSFADVEVEYSSIFEDVARVSVSGVWITHINIRRGRLYLEGRASKPHNISRWLKQLRPMPSLKERNFEEVVVRSPLDDKNVMFFKLYEKGYEKGDGKNESLI